MSKLTKKNFIQWNAVLISKAANWNHSLVTPWPKEPGGDANAMGALERYLGEIQSVLNYMRTDAGLPPLVPSTQEQG